MRRVLVLSLTALLFANCGKSSPTAPSSQSQTFTGTVAAFGTDSKTISITKTGSLTVTLSGNAAGSFLILYLTGSGCNVTNPLNNGFTGGCALFGTPNGAATAWTGNVNSGDSYKFWVDNFDSASHAWTVTVSVP